MTNNRRILTSIVLCVGASAISFLGAGFAVAYDPPYPPPEAALYGMDGNLNQRDLVVLFYLQFPQSYNAIKNRFGFPLYRTQTTDYYQIEGTTNWVAIRYDRQTAWGYQLSGSQ